MDSKKLQERIEKSEEKLFKLNKTLSGHLVKLQKLYKKYSDAKELHTLLPVDLFIKFDTETKYSWKEETDYLKEFGPYTISVIHNKEAFRHYVAECEKHGSIAKIGVHEFLYDAEEVARQIVNKREEIKDVEARIRDYKQQLSLEAKKDNKVDALFKKVPMLKEFIEKCGEAQYNFLIKHNKAIKEAWDKYYKLDREVCNLWNSGNHGEEYKTKSAEARKIKPKVFVRTEEQIKNDVEHWKKAESQLMAERIKTEFGEVEGADLYLGADGNVNGIIKGTDKTAHINTIFAGGYNIQCLHTRLLVHDK